MPSIEDLVLRIQTIGGKAAATEMETVGAATRGVGSTAKTVAGVAGIGALAIGLKDVTEAAIKWQQQQANLQGALRNMGLLTTENVKTITDAAETLATQGGFDPATSIQGITKLVTAHESVTEAIKNNTLATDISRRANIPYATAIRLISVVEQGRTTGLARMGIVIPPVTAAVDALRASHQKLTPEMLAQAKAQDKQASSVAAMTELWKRYGGATEQYSKTAAGGASNLRNEIDILGQKIGTFLLPIIQKFIGFLDKVVQYFVKNKTAMQDLITALTVLGALWGVSKIIGLVTWLITLAGTIAKLTGLEWLFTTAQLAMTAAAGDGAAALGILAVAIEAVSMLTLIGELALVAAGIYLIITHFKEIKNWVVQNWKPVVAVLVAPFLALAVVVTGTFLAIRFALNNVWGWIKSAWHTLEGPLTLPFIVVRNVVNNVWNATLRPFFLWIRGPFFAIVDVFKAIGGVVGNVFGTAFGIVKTVWNTILVPFAKFVGSTAAGGFGFIMTVVKEIGSAFNTAFNIIMTVVNFVKDHVIKPFIDVVNTMLGPLKDALKTIGDIANAAGNAASDIAGGISSITDSTAPITAAPNIGGTGQTGTPGRRGASGGLWGGGKITVGERGIENVYLPPQSLIVPNHFLRPDVGSGDGQPLEAHMSLQVGPYEFARAVAYAMTKTKSVR